MPLRPFLLPTLALALCFAAAPGRADPVAEPASEVAPDLYRPDPQSGVALRGFDPVSYFRDGGAPPLPGRAASELVAAGAVWRFAGPANREAFRRAPESFLPRLGGYDPEGVRRGRLVDADPLVPAVVEGRLYLFRTAEGRARALADPAVLAEAEERWPDLRNELSSAARAALR